MLEKLVFGVCCWISGSFFCFELSYVY